MNQSEQSFAGIDETIGQVEKLYRAVTGMDAPTGEAVYAPIPAEKDPSQHVEEQLNRLLELLAPPKSGADRAPNWIPAVSVWEADSEIVVCVDLPGLRREQVDVVVDGNTVTVSGSQLPTRDGLRLRSSERGLGSFRRTLFVPRGIRSSEPSAQMRDGVLELRFEKQKTQEAAARAVPVH